MTGTPGSDPGLVPDPLPGTVVSGGPTEVQVLPEVVLRKVSVSTMDNNCYLLSCRITGDQVLVDAADDVPRLLRLLDEAVPEGRRRLRTVVTTHRHADHHRALAGVLAATGAASAAGRDDAAALPVPPEVLLDHGDRVAVGASNLEVVALRGHTPGSVALVLSCSDGGVHLLSGDSLFPGGPGRTRTPADFETLMTDLTERVFARFGDPTRVYPGHGRDTTLGAERPHLATWWARSW